MNKKLIARLTDNGYTPLEALAIFRKVSAIEAISQWAQIVPDDLDPDARTGWISARDRIFRMAETAGGPDVFAEDLRRLLDSVPGPKNDTDRGRLRAFNEALTALGKQTYTGTDMPIMEKPPSASPSFAPGNNPDPRVDKGDGYSPGGGNRNIKDIGMGSGRMASVVDFTLPHYYDQTTFSDRVENPSQAYKFLKINGGFMFWPVENILDGPHHDQIIRSMPADTKLDLAGYYWPAGHSSSRGFMKDNGWHVPQGSTLEVSADLLATEEDLSQLGEITSADNIVWNENPIISEVDGLDPETQLSLSQGFKTSNQVTNKFDFKSLSNLRRLFLPPPPYPPHDLKIAHLGGLSSESFYRGFPERWNPDTMEREPWFYSRPPSDHCKFWIASDGDIYFWKIGDDLRPPHMTGGKILESQGVEPVIPGVVEDGRIEAFPTDEKEEELRDTAFAKIAARAPYDELPPSFGAGAIMDLVKHVRLRGPHINWDHFASTSVRPPEELDRMLEILTELGIAESEDENRIGGAFIVYPDELKSLLRTAEPEYKGTRPEPPPQALEKASRGLRKNSGLEMPPYEGSEYARVAIDSGASEPAGYIGSNLPYWNEPQGISSEDKVVITPTQNYWFPVWLEGMEIDDGETNTDPHHEDYKEALNQEGILGVGSYEHGMFPVCVVFNDDGEAFENEDPNEAIENLKGFSKFASRGLRKDSGAYRVDLQQQKTASAVSFNNEDIKGYEMGYLVFAPDGKSYTWGSQDSASFVVGVAQILYENGLGDLFEMYPDIQRVFDLDYSAAEDYEEIEELTDEVSMLEQEVWEYAESKGLTFAFYDSFEGPDVVRFQNLGMVSEATKSAILETLGNMEDANAGQLEGGVYVGGLEALSDAVNEEYEMAYDPDAPEGTVAITQILEAVQSESVDIMDVVSQQVPDPDTVENELKWIFDKDTNELWTWTVADLYGVRGWPHHTQVLIYFEDAGRTIIDAEMGHGYPHNYVDVLDYGSEDFQAARMVAERFNEVGFAPVIKYEEIDYDIHEFANGELVEVDMSKTAAEGEVVGHDENDVFVEQMDWATYVRVDDEEIKEFDVDDYESPLDEALGWVHENFEGNNIFLAMDETGEFVDVTEHMGDKDKVVDVWEDGYSEACENRKTAAKGRYTFIIDPDGTVHYSFQMSPHEELIKSETNEPRETLVKGWVDGRDMQLYPSAYTENGPEPTRMTDWQILAAIEEIPQFEAGGFYHHSKPVVEVEWVTLEFPDYSFDASFEEFVEQFAPNLQDDEDFDLDMGQTYSKLAGADHDGAMIALRPPQKFVDKLKDLADEPDNLHVTLAYLPDVEEVDENELVHAVEDLIGENRGLEFKVTGRVSGFGTFANDGNHVLWASVDIPHIDDIRHEIADLLEGEYVEDLDEKFGFTPHMTLQYQDTPFKELPDFPDGLSEPGQWELCVVYKDNWTKVANDSAVQFDLSVPLSEKKRYNGENAGLNLEANTSPVPGPGHDKFVIIAYPEPRGYFWNDYDIDHANVLKELGYLDTLYGDEPNDGSEVWMGYLSAEEGGAEIHTEQDEPDNNDLGIIRRFFGDREVVLWNGNNVDPALFSNKLSSYAASVIEVPFTIPYFLKFADRAGVEQKAQKIFDQGGVEYINATPDKDTGRTLWEFNVMSTSGKEYPLYGETTTANPNQWIDWFDVACSCDWGKWNYDRAPDYKHLERFPCSHAQATEKWLETNGKAAQDRATREQETGQSEIRFEQEPERGARPRPGDVYRQQMQFTPQEVKDRGLMAPRPFTEQRGEPPVPQIFEEAPQGTVVAPPRPGQTAPAPPGTPPPGQTGGRPQDQQQQFAPGETPPPLDPPLPGPPPEPPDPELSLREDPIERPRKPLEGTWRFSEYDKNRN